MVDHDSASTTAKPATTSSATSSSTASASAPAPVSVSSSAPDMQDNSRASYLRHKTSRISNRSSSDSRDNARSPATLTNSTSTMNTSDDGLLAPPSAATEYFSAENEQDASSSNSSLSENTRSAAAHPGETRTRGAFGRRKTLNTSSSTAGTFLTRFLGTFRGVTSDQQQTRLDGELSDNNSTSNKTSRRPLLPRSLSSPLTSRSYTNELSLEHQDQSSSSDLPGESTPKPSPPRSTAVTNAAPTPNPTGATLSAIDNAQGSGGSTKQRFRPPSFIRRSSTGTPRASPSNSPKASPSLVEAAPRPSPGSPATLKGRERDPMDLIATRASGLDGTRLARRGSAVSQMTVLGDTTPMLPTSAGGIFKSLHPIAEPDSVSPVIDRPLDLIATLIPTALHLLAQLGPSHLYSPPVSLPAFAGLFQSYDNLNRPASSSAASRPTDTAYHASDRASIASSVTSAASSHGTAGLFPLNQAHLAPSYSHELYAPSLISFPAVSAAAIWRLFCGLEWLSEVGQPNTARKSERTRTSFEEESALTSEEESERDAASSSFDFPSMLQGVADVLSSVTAGKGVELVIGQVGQGRSASPGASPSLADDRGGVRRDGSSATITPETSGATSQKTTTASQVIESAELLVQGEERAWSLALIWILHELIMSATTGATIDVRFQATLSATPPRDLSSISERTIDESQHTLQQPKTVPDVRTWVISLEIVHTLGPAQQSHSFGAFSSSRNHSPAHVPAFNSLQARSLFAHPQIQLGLKELPATETDVKAWTLESLLTAAKTPSSSSRDDEPSFLGARRGSGETIAAGQEPTIEELKKFAENGLRGLRVALHASENGPFAKHLTSYLAGWGMDVSHIPLDTDDTSSCPIVRGSAADSSATSSHEPVNSPLKSFASDGSAFTGSALGTDPTSNVIVIDDDVTTLRRLLHTLRAPPLLSQTPLLGKRPQLATRRTRSSPHVRQVHQLPPTHANWVIVHFASLTHFKTIKEIVQDALANTRSPTLPEVLVIPKPAGPRRIITSLWTALKRPSLDPSLAPIATSPAAPGVQYWAPRLSPALGRDEDAFDMISDRGEGTVPSSSNASIRVRTPPTSGMPAMPTGHPPSPLRNISDDQVSYFTGVAEGLDGTTPSEGVVLQSPNGRPAIFFQPSTRRLTGSSSKSTSRQDREREVSGGALNRSRTSIGSPTSPKEADSDAQGMSSPSSARAAAPVATPHDIGLGHPRRSSSSAGSSSSPTAESPHLVPIGTPALTLDSFILSAKSRAAGEPESSPESIEPVPASARPTGALKRQESSASLSSRLSAARLATAGSAASATGASSPRMAASAASGAASRRMTSGGNGVTPPISPSPGSPNASLAAKVNSVSAPTTPPTFHSTAPRRSVIPAPKTKRRPSRKITLPAVPPINVLIVEDNPINQMILSTFMKKKGIKYAVAKDGEEAVQKWKAGSFHLVLMDIQLPVKDGIEATRDIREMERANNIGTFITTPTADLSSPISSTSTSTSSGSVPSSNSSPQLNTPMSPLLLSMPVIIVALTASSLQADRVNALAAGCNDFLTKPVSLVWLEKKLREWGSMAYLSGFSAYPADSSSTTSRSSTTPTPRMTANASNKAFAAGMNSKAAVISSHLHIDPKPHSPSGSNSSGTTPGGTQPLPASQVERRLPVNGDVPSPPSDHPTDLSCPKVTIQAPTPEVDPSAGTEAPAVSPRVPPTIPETSTSPDPSPNSVSGAAEQGIDAPMINEETIGTVDDKLRDLAEDQATPSNQPPMLSPTVLSNASRRPGPSPLAQSSTMSPDGAITHEMAGSYAATSSSNVHEALAEGARVIDVGASRTNSNDTNGNAS